MIQIFLSYRREDSSYVAASLNEKLEKAFGCKSVFFDVDTIPIGVDFRTYITSAIEQCNVLLVLIADKWTISNSQGKRRLDDSSDYVHIEIDLALKRNIPIVPVLIGDTKMPTIDDLPEPLQKLAFRNATKIRSGRDYLQDIERIVKDLKVFVELKSDKKDKSNLEITKISSPDCNNANLDYVIKQFDGFSDSCLYIGDNIPLDKTNNAISSYALLVEPKDIILLYDNTLLGSANHGLLLVSDAVYWRDYHGLGYIKYIDIKFVKIKNHILSKSIQINEFDIPIQMGNAKKIIIKLIKILQYYSSLAPPPY